MMLVSPNVLSISDEELLEKLRVWVIRLHLVNANLVASAPNTIEDCEAMVRLLTAEALRRMSEGRKAGR